MEIVHNLSDYNHEEALWEIFRESPEILCCSPFLSKSVDLFESLYDVKIHLITTLKQNKAEQLEKVDYFNYLYDVAKRNNLELQISIDNHLHGKVYIRKDREAFVSAVVTSANLTTAGMIENHELGIRFHDQQVISKLVKQIEEAIEFPNITKKDLSRFSQEIEKKGYNGKKTFGNKNIDLQLVRLLDEKALVVPYFANKDSKYWLKPLGAKEHPFSPYEVLENETQILHFSKRPKAIDVGDIVISYGVGVRKILSVFLIIDGPKEATKQEKKRNKDLERWNWYMIGKNMTLKYGRKWNNHNLTLKRLKDEFLSLHPEKNLTTKSKSLGALRYHADKVKLSEGFAYFVIGKVMDGNV